MKFLHGRKDAAVQQGLLGLLGGRVGGGWAGRRAGVGGRVGGGVGGVGRSETNAKNLDAEVCGATVLFRYEKALSLTLPATQTRHLSLLWLVSTE